MHLAADDLTQKNVYSAAWKRGRQHLQMGCWCCVQLGRFCEMVHLHNKKVSVKAHVFIRGRPTKILPQWIRCQLYTGRKKEIKPPTLDLFRYLDA